MQCRAYLESQPDAQIVCLGGGLDPLSLDPLSLDLAESYPAAVVYDVDLASMALKKEITEAIDGPKIKFCGVDLTDPDGLVSTLKTEGWDPSHPTLLVAEGITYYVPKRLFKAALAALRVPGGALVLEYSLPDEMLADTARASDYKSFFERLYQLLRMPFRLYTTIMPTCRSLPRRFRGAWIERSGSLSWNACEREKTFSVRIRSRVAFRFQPFGLTD